MHRMIFTRAHETYSACGRVKSAKHHMAPALLPLLTFFCIVVERNDVVDVKPKVLYAGKHQSTSGTLCHEIFDCVSISSHGEPAHNVEIIECMH